MTNLEDMESEDIMNLFSDYEDKIDDIRSFLKPLKRVSSGKTGYYFPNEKCYQTFLSIQNEYLELNNTVKKLRPFVEKMYGNSNYVNPYPYQGKSIFE